MTILARERLIGLPKSTTSVDPIPVRVKVMNNLEFCHSDFDAVRREQVHFLEVPASVRPGMLRVTLPSFLVDELGLLTSGTSRVVFPDGHCDVWPLVQDLRLQLCGRDHVFSALVDPVGTEIRIGTMVLDVLDLVIEWPSRHIRPRDPSGIVIDL